MVRKRQKQPSDPLGQAADNIAAAAQQARAAIATGDLLKAP